MGQGQLNVIVNVAISLQAKAVPQASFAIPLVIGSSGRYLNGDFVRYYSSLSGMTADGFLTSDPEYKHVTQALAQSLVPTQVAVGQRGSQVAQVDTVTVLTATSSHVYEVSITDTLGNTVNYTYTASGGDTVDTIATALASAIGASSIVTAVATGAAVAITAVTAGYAFGTNINADAKMSLAHTTANVGIVSDITNIQTQSDLWYGIDLCSENADWDVTQLASWAESETKIFIPASKDSGIATSASNDLASYLKSASYTRTGLIYTLTQANLDNGIAAAWLGGQLPQVPGSSTWKFKTLAGITADTYTSTQRGYLIGVPGTPGKNANIYENVGGVNITEDGWMAGGQFIDVTVGMDWFKSQAQNNIYTQLVNNPKIPYTNAGGTVIQNAITAAIKQGIANGLIDGTTAYNVTVPPILSIGQTDRTNRNLTGVTFSFRLAGAFHYITISGVVTT